MVNDMVQARGEKRDSCEGEGNASSSSPDPPSSSAEYLTPGEDRVGSRASNDPSPPASNNRSQGEESLSFSSSSASSNETLSDSRASSGDPDIPMRRRPWGTAPRASAATAAVTAPVPTDQERQLLLLMLLGQVCALHDPTPRTFTAHVLEFFERGILDRQSIHFLYRLGLVPSVHPIKEGGGDSKDEGSDRVKSDAPVFVQQEHPLLLLPAPMSELSVVAVNPKRTTAPRHDPRRSAEVSAIRDTLERQELQRQIQIQNQQQRRLERWSRAQVAGTNRTNAAPPAAPYIPALPPPPRRSVSFAAEHHPLSFSRFQREFGCARALNAGAFGVVYRATSKMDGIDYAVKVVEFTASGFDGGSVQRVVREVQCLAKCDHANVVRYYTSWLEPSWMTGSSRTDASSRLTDGASAEYGRTAPEDKSRSRSEPRRRHHLHRLLRTESPVDLDGLSDDLQALFLRPDGEDRYNGNLNRNDVALFSSSSLPSLRREMRHIRRHSWDEDQTESRSRSLVDEYSEWTAKDDLFIDSRPSPPRSIRRLRSNATRSDRVPSTAGGDYQYQICLFIQMQLCTSITLSDWIRERNNDGGEDLSATSNSRLDVASQVFLQLALGLAHVHHKGIIHRDLKPSNVFVCHEPHGINFKIGDFGLSKLIRSALHDDSEGNYPQQGPAQRVVFEELDDREGHFVVQRTDPELVDAPSDCKQRDIPVGEPLTAGVGTASYAAPEQATSKAYGSSADIFSLGLILLELLCCFSTEHERLHVFGDCRHRRKVPDEVAQFPIAARTILSCTEPDPTKRPTALELSMLNLRHETAEAPSSRDAQYEALVQQLAAKEREVEHYKLQLQERQRTIESLERELQRKTSGSPASIFTYPKPQATNATHSEQEVSSSSSSDENC